MHRRVFVDHENATMGPAILWACGSSLRREVGFVEGQAHPELGAHLTRRLVGEISTVRLHQAVAERESQPGTFSGCLGREEWGEEVGRQMPRYSGTIVSDSQHRLSVLPAGDQDDAPVL